MPRLPYRHQITMACILDFNQDNVTVRPYDITMAVSPSSASSSPEPSAPPADSMFKTAAKKIGGGMASAAGALASGIWGGATYITQAALKNSGLDESTDGLSSDAQKELESLEKDITTIVKNLYIIALADATEHEAVKQAVRTIAETNLGKTVKRVTEHPDGQNNKKRVETHVIQLGVTKTVVMYLSTNKMGVTSYTDISILAHEEDTTTDLTETLYEAGSDLDVWSKAAASILKEPLLLAVGQGKYFEKSEVTTRKSIGGTSFIDPEVKKYYTSVASVVVKTTTAGNTSLTSWESATHAKFVDILGQK